MKDGTTYKDAGRIINRLKHPTEQGSQGVAP